MKVLFGLLYLTAIFKSAHEDANSLSATDGIGRDIFRLIMTQAISFLAFRYVSTIAQYHGSTVLSVTSKLITIVVNM